MAGMLQKQLPALLAVGALAAACAHTPPAGQVPIGGASAAATPSTTAGEPATASPQDETKKPVRVLITGSRLPYYVQPGSQVLPTYGPISVYGRDAILSTGREDLGEALRALDPSISTHR